MTPDVDDAHERAMRSNPAYARLVAELATPYRRFKPRPDNREAFDEQTAFSQSTAKVSVLLGGTGAGKTVAAARRVARRLREEKPPRPNCPYWVIGETYDLSCGVCWDEKLSRFIPPSMIHSVDWYKRSRNWPFAVMLKHPDDPSRVGWAVEFKSFKQGRERMQAASIGGAWFNEQPPLDLVDEVLGRTRDYDSPVEIDFTPLKACAEWPKRYRRPPPGWRFFHVNSELNTALAEGWVGNFLASVPQDYRETRRIGLFASAVGAVFKDWRYDRHVVPPFEIPADAFRLRGIDFGYVAPFVCVWVARLPRSMRLADGRLALEGTWVLYREYTKRETLLVDHATAIMQAEAWGRDHHVYGPTVADHDAQATAELRKVGFPTTPADKGDGSVERGIYALQKLMMTPPGDNVAPMLLVFDTCPVFIDEAQGYRYEPGTDARDSREQPIKKNDHTLDAARYAIAYGLTGAGEFPREALKVETPIWRTQGRGFLG